MTGHVPTYTAVHECSSSVHCECHQSLADHLMFRSYHLYTYTVYLGTPVLCGNFFKNMRTVTRQNMRQNYAELGHVRIFA